MITLSDVVEFIHNPLAYEQRLVSVINKKGEQIPLNYLQDLYTYKEKTIKIEGMERYSPSIYNKCNWYKVKYSHPGAVTCHAFIAQENSPSFPMHTDPDDVIIYCFDGEKHMVVDGENIILKQGEEYFIPANTPHMALNTKNASILSFGLEKFLIDKATNNELHDISENNRNLQLKL